MQVFEAADPRGTVVLFQPRFLHASWGPERFPYNLVPVIGATQAAGYRVVFLEEAHDGAPTDAWREHLERACAAVVWCGELYPATQIPGLRAFLGVAKRCAAPPVVVGGGFFGIVDPAGLELGDDVAAVVTGPGELVLPRCIDALREGRSLAEVGGISLWEDGEHVATPAVRRGPLDPAWNRPLHQFDLDRYLIPDPLVFGNGEPALQILTGSGCAKRCPFCFNGETPWGVYPAETVVESVARIHARYGVRQFLLGELDLFHKTARAVEIARGLAALDLPITYFALGSICDLLRLTDAELRIVAASGCRLIEIGSESGSDQLLTRLRKGHCAAEILEAARRLHACGITATHNFVFGVPGESAADRRATLRLVREIRRVQPDARFSAHLFQIIPNTPIGREALAWVERFPRSLSEMETYRNDLTGSGRSLPWFGARVERRIKRLTGYLLPMAYEETEGGAAPASRRVLRALARLHCRSGIHLGATWEERWARRTRAPLPGTYIP